jgi:subtilisin family serine protease
MIVRGLHHVAGAVLGALLLLGLASKGLAQTDALWLKASEAAEITAIAQQNGHVRVIVLFDSPIPPGQLKPDPGSVANAKAQVAAARDAIVSWHFGSATSPAQGQGFDRGLSRFQVTPGFAVNVSPSELQALANDPRVARINYDRVLRTNLIDSVPLIGMTAAYTQGATGAGQAVAVLDTGVKSDHEFLFGKVVAEACFSNAFPSATSVSLCPNTTQSQTGPGSANAETFNCLNGSSNLCLHGTHVAGIAAGLNTDQQAGEPPNGVAKEAKIFAIQIFTKFTTTGECTPDPAPCIGSWVSDQIHGLDYVFSNINLGGGNVVASVNMSLGGGLFSGTCDTGQGSSQKPAIDALRGAGVLTAVASGNDGSKNQISTPACISTAVAVGATTKGDQISSFSNISSTVDLLAPGESIQSSVPQLVVGGNNNTTTYLFASGTSMAAPHVAGAIAAMRSACPSATADAIENALKSTGTPILDSRPGGTQTKPRIRVDLAVQNLVCGTAPVVTQNPSNLTVTAGQQATFTAAATGTPTPTVIWQLSFDGGTVYHDIAWATSTTLTFTTDSSHNGYLFRAKFTNSAGTATTTVATLTVTSGPSAPVVTQNPSNLTVTAGQQATFTAAASGTPTPTVIWQVSTNGGATYNNIGWATSTTLSFTTVSSHNGYLFRAVFTNANGSATTTAATLTVNAGGPVAPSITQNPSDQTVAAGQQATFKALANGEPAPTVQWQVSFDGGVVYHNIQWATSTTLTFTTMSSHNGYRFRAVFTNSAGTATTTIAFLTVT